MKTTRSFRKCGSGGLHYCVVDQVVERPNLMVASAMLAFNSLLTIYSENAIILLIINGGVIL